MCLAQTASPKPRPRISTSRFKCPITSHAPEVSTPSLSTQISLTLPASTGNVCTVRCRNTAVAGPFGGCFAVQQVDTDEKTNTPNNINTIQQLDVVLAQVEQNQADFPDAIKANQNAGSDEAEQNLAAVDALLGNTIVTNSFAAETPSVVLGGVPAATTTAAAAAATTTDATTGGNNGNANGNGNNGNGNNGNGNNGNDNNRGGNSRGNRFGNGNNRKRLLSSAMRWGKRGEEGRAERQMLE